MQQMQQALQQIMLENQELKAGALNAQMMGTNFLELTAAIKAQGEKKGALCRNKSRYKSY